MLGSRKNTFGKTTDFRGVEMVGIVLVLVPVLVAEVEDSERCTGQTIDNWLVS
jgi:hypothetical protein